MAHFIIRIGGLITIVALLLVPIARAQEGGLKGSSEYFSANRTGRLLIDVQVWGDIALPGIHHIPDTTSIVELLGFVGGAKGDLKDAKLRIRQKSKEGKGYQTIEFAGEELLDNKKAAETLLQSGDIIYVEAKSSEDKFMNRVNIITAVASLITSIVVTIFLIQDKR